MKCLSASINPWIDFNNQLALQNESPYLYQICFVYIFLDNFTKSILQFYLLHLLFFSNFIKQDLQLH